MVARRIADSNSINAVSFSSACTTEGFPSSRCASAIQIVRPLESIAETQPQLKPAWLRLSAMVSQYFISRRAWLLLTEQPDLVLLFLRRERGDDFLEARIDAQRIP